MRLPSGDRVDLCVYRADREEGRSPVIIFSPGFGGTKEIGGSALKVCEEATGAGMVFISFSPFSFGATEGADGDFTYGRWSTNIEEILRWVRAQPWADPGRIGCFAISSGTTAAIRYAQRSDDLRFVISVATCISIHVGMSDSPHRRFLSEALARGSDEVPPYFGKTVGRAFYVDAETGAPVFDMPKTRCPVFFLQGADDNPWRRSDAWMGWQVMLHAGLPVKYKEVPGGDHGLDNRADLCAEEILGWLREIGIL